MTHVRCHRCLESFSTKNIDKLERVQRKIVKFWCFTFGLLYSHEGYRELCIGFGLPTLADHRKVLGILFLHKCITGGYDTSAILAKLCSNVTGKNLR